MSTHPLPLAGRRVLDLSRALAGPLCGTLLADLAAEVTKVEPLGGDPSRAWGPFDGSRSLYFDAINHGKRSIALDFRHPEAAALLGELVKGADVVIESFRPGVMDELGLGTEGIRRLNPRIVVVSVSGFGATGPLRTSAGLDQIAQSMSGLASVTGPDADHRYRVGVPIVDFMTGLVAVIGALAGLARDSSEGAHVETSLLETALYSLVFQAQQALRLAEDPVPQGNMHPTIQPYGTYRAADGEITLAASTDRHWRTLCTVLGDAELADDVRFASPAERVRSRDALTARLEELLAQRTVDEWLELLRPAGIPAGPVNGVRAALGQPQVDALGLVAHVPDADGLALPLLTAPFSIDGERLAVSQAPPALGAGARAALRSYGMSDTAIDRYVAVGVLPHAA